MEIYCMGQKANRTSPGGSHGFGVWSVALGQIIFRKGSIPFADLDSSGQTAWPSEYGNVPNVRERIFCFEKNWTLGRCSQGIKHLDSWRLLLLRLEYQCCGLNSSWGCKGGGQ